MWFFFSFMGAIASFSVAQVFQFRMADDRLHVQAHDLLSLAVKIATQSRETLSAINRLTTSPCSEKDVQELRYILYLTPYIQDVGRSTEGKITCTAVWGQLTTPIQLPEAEWKNERRTALWRNIHGAPDNRLIYDIGLVAGKAVAFTRRNLFQHFETANKNFQAIIFSPYGDHVLASMGTGTPAMIPLLNQPNGILTYVGRHAYECEKNFDMCALVQSKVSKNITSTSPLTALSITLLGALAGAGAGHGLSRQILSKRTLEKQLERALERNLIGVVYQPIVRLSDRTIVGVEVLARWTSEDRVSVSPEIFVPIIEKMGQTRKLTRLVIDKSLAELEETINRDSYFYASLNVTVEDITCPEFRKMIIEKSRLHNIEPNRIALEITERQTTDMATLQDAVKDLRKFGFKVFIDDFGTGYSGISYLANTPVDAVKVDKMFTKSIGTHSIQSRMLDNICKMISDVNGSIIFEGVETEEQASLLQNLYPTENAQGWFFWKAH
ncbi:EAL domain-containing protein [Pseudooceanicola spongiae]|nr:EAL domain-containing protein [Pseudooceanicola spongiae]